MAKNNLLFLCSLLLISLIRCQRTPISPDPSYYYNLCAPSRCGNLTLAYPFALPTPCHPSPYEIACQNNKFLLLHNPISTDPTYRVLSINYSDPITISVAYNNLFTCGTHLSYTGFFGSDYSFMLPFTYTYGMHYNCTTPIPLNSIQKLQNASCIGCKGQDPSNFCYYAPQFVNTGPPGCEILFMVTRGGPSSFNATTVTDVRALLQRGYELRYKKVRDCRGCEVTGGRCGSNPTTNGSFICFCPSSVHAKNCTDEMPVDISTWANEVRDGGSGLLHKGLVADIFASVFALLLLVVIVALVIIFTRGQSKNFHFSKQTISEISHTRYSHSQLKKFTNNFSTKLGEGGFGSVYKGRIQRHGAETTVAVKLMKKTTEIEKQFMNEVGTIGSVHHHNLVSILGYCVDRGTHALVYEFMENGSLDNYIYRSKKVSENKRLSIEQLYIIALETARGILYLHQDCRVKILHCDIKPSNVLLDSNFSAKVADFGLARMINKDCSHVSLTVAHGTPGYAAPEMWWKSFGPVTEKSDVYSYGMLLLEMVGRRKIYDSDVSDSSEAYFPEWLYNKMVQDQVSSLLKDSDGGEILGEESNQEVVRRMCLVALRCIQHIPSNRPSMDRVIQMLEGHVEIGIPPNPSPHYL
ncbi:non-specific serine/threonine protein kinase [Ranunculus cassubicifolius]